MKVLCVSSDPSWAGFLRVALEKKGCALTVFHDLPIALPNQPLGDAVFIDSERLLNWAREKWAETITYLSDGGNRVVVVFDASSPKELFRDVILAGAFFCFSRDNFQDLCTALNMVAKKKKSQRKKGKRNKEEFG